PRFEVENVAVFEVTHMELTDRRGRLGTVSYPVNHESAHTADSFTAVVIEGHRLFALRSKLFVEDGEHLQERHMRVHIRMLVSDHLADVVRAFLPPNVESQFHYL